MLQSHTRIRVRYAETDMMGIVYHGSYATWFEMARVEMMDRFGYPYLEMERDGYRLPVLELHARYKRSVTFDDHVTVEAVLREKPGARIRIEYRVTRGDEEVAEGATLHAFVNHNGRPVRPPARFTEGMAALFDRSDATGPS